MSYYATGWQFPSFLPLIQDGLIINVITTCISFYKLLVRLILSARIDASLLIWRLAVLNEQGHELDILTSKHATTTSHNATLHDLVNIFSFFVVPRGWFEFFACWMFRQDLHLPTYWITTVFDFIAKVSYMIMHVMVWFYTFLRRLCCAELQLLYTSSDGAPLSFCWIIESQPLDHDFNKRPHHNFAQSPLLLKLHFFSPRATSRLHHWHM